MQSQPRAAHDHTPFSLLDRLSRTPVRQPANGLTGGEESLC